MKKSRLIHVAYLFLHGNWQMLQLWQMEDNTFCWYENDKSLSIHTNQIEEALRLVKNTYQKHPLRFLNCGFRFTLPERDEHGMNALFYQMKASYNSMTGIYFDDELMASCIVRFAPSDSLKLLRTEFCSYG